MAWHSDRTKSDADQALVDLERRWRIVGAAIIVVVLALAGGGAFCMGLIRRPFPARYRGGWPLSHPYNGLESLVLHYWPLWIPAAFAIGALLVIWLGLQRGVLALGGILLLLGMTLGVAPIRAYPEKKRTPGPGSCQAVFGNLGTYGDDDETCYDVRRARSFDVGVTVGTGLLIVAAGVGLRMAKEALSGISRKTAE